jgi:hypothetical protein
MSEISICAGTPGAVKPSLIPLALLSEIVESVPEFVTVTTFIVYAFDGATVGGGLKLLELLIREPGAATEIEALVDPEAREVVALAGGDWLDGQT